MPIVYRHIRLDTNMPFYIGIGKTINRAYSIKGRSKYWNNIVNKHGYEVEILFDNLTWEEACKKEKEFIALYGRHNVNKGLLCNLTDGGDGSLGYIPSQDALLKISNASKGRIKTPEQIDKWKANMNFSKSKEVREKIRQSLLGKKHSEKRKENQRKAHLGKKLSEETKEKLRQIRKGIKTGPLSEVHVQKLRESHRGIKQSEETKLKRKQTWALKRVNNLSQGYRQTMGMP
jgi:hypothetical protein